MQQAYTLNSLSERWLAADVDFRVVHTKKESDESLTLLVLGRGIEPLLQD